MGVENQVLANLERGASDRAPVQVNPFTFEHAMPFGLLRVTATGETSATFASVGPLRFEGREVMAKGSGAVRDGAWVVEEIETTMPNARSFATAVGREKLQQFQEALGRNLARAAGDNEMAFLHRGIVSLRREEQRVEAAITSTEEEIRHRQARLATLSASRERMGVDHAAQEARMRARMAELEVLAAAPKPIASKPRRAKP